jgi:long-chain fatty acid transport protein
MSRKDCRFCEEEGHFMKGVLRAALVASASLVSMQAMAGGFINTSQSTVFNGMAFAGFAAPGSSSAETMFMNPATMTSFSRLTIDTNYTFGIPTTKITGTANVPALNALFSRNSSDVGLDCFVPATYVVYPVNDQLFLGVSINSTYGNSTKANDFWLGGLFAMTSKLRIITVTPSVAYKINHMFSVGLGLQVQYTSARQTAQFPAGIGLPVYGGVGITSADGWVLA